MSLVRFLNDLREHGRVRVGSPEAPSVAELAQADEVIRQMDLEVRADAPLDPPPLSPPVARWAALLLYRACYLFAHTEAGQQEVDRLQTGPCPEPPSPRAAWSADLVFRFLPDLCAMARRRAPGDPLVDALKSIATQWPLSSVGIHGVPAPDLSAFAADPSLLRIYVDRVLDRADLTRLSDPLVAEAARGAIGAFPSLCPAASKALREGT